MISGIGVSAAQDRPMIDVGSPFGALMLVDEVVVGANEDTHGFIESAPGVSEIQDIFDQPTRVINNVGGARFFGYRLGQGKGLAAGRAYVLRVEYPEDAPRTTFVINRGGEYGRGFSTGVSVGDSLDNYTNNNPESLDYPLAGAPQFWQTLFYLHENYTEQALSLQGPMARPDTPENGFMVYIAQLGSWSAGNPAKRQAPLSQGAAISRIQLFEVPDPEALYAPVVYPPGDLPRRHLFWREEMSDGAIHQRNNQTAVTTEVDWFEHKARLMKFLGMNTYSKDLLEFGANQGWDSALHGGNNWVHQSDNPQRWSDILEMLGRYDFSVLPMYEYCGSKGDNSLGYQTQARPLRRDRYVNGEENTCVGYTHIWWGENCNVDIANPAALDDLTKMLEATIVRHKDRVPFVGAWLRTRVSDIPVSFSDYSLAMFSEETGQTPAITRQMLVDDEALLATYVTWWKGKRRAFLAGVRDYLQGALGEESVLLFTAYHEEPGPWIGGGIVTDDQARWQASGRSTRPWEALATGDAYLQAALAPVGNWDDGGCMDPAKRRFEWHHGCPRPDPENAKDMDGFLFTYPFNRLYTVSSKEGFDAFRGPAGLAIIRHYSLNENTMNVLDTGQQTSPLGYFVSDVDRNGPYSVLAEARALAYGDPRYIGYLTAQNYNRGFPEYVRRFNLAFLALPAVPSEVWSDASSHETVVVRAYPTADHGTYLAVVNTGFEPVESVSVTLPDEGPVSDALTGDALPLAGRSFSLDLYPGEVRALVFQSSTSTPLGDAGMGEPSGPDGSVDTPGLSEDGGVPGSTSDMTSANDENERSSGSGSGGGCAMMRSPSPAWIAVLVLFGLARRRRSSSV